MRHPVSTPCCVETERGTMASGIVSASIGPHTPEHAGPGAGEDANGVRMIATARAGLGIDGRRPLRCMARVIGEAGNGAAQAVVAGPAEGDAAALAGLVSQRRDAGLGGQMRVAGEAVTDIAQLGEDLRGAHLSGSWQ